MEVVTQPRVVAKLGVRQHRSHANPGGPVEDGGCTVAVRRYNELPGWLVIVVTGGGPVELFLRTPPAAVPA